MNPGPLKQDGVSGTRLRIYFFSGTGNARSVANWIADRARTRGIESECMNIAGIRRRGLTPPEADAMIGFVSPTHGFNYPPVMMYFIFAFPCARYHNPVFLMNTRGGVRLGPVNIPGLSGVTLLLAALVLLLKGYRIAGMRPIDLPSNWLSIHPSLRPKAIVALYERCRTLTATFADRLLDGKKDFHALFDIVQDLLIAPVSLGYFLVGRYVFAKSFYATGLCDNCDACRKECPVGAIITVRDRPFWTYHCESCMRCMNTCPRRAIQTGHGYVAAVIFISSSFLADRLWVAASTYLQLPPDPILAWLARFVADTAVLLGLLALIYRGVHLGIRVPVLRSLIEYSSLTRYRFWGRYTPAKILHRQAASGAGPVRS